MDRRCRLDPATSHFVRLNHLSIRSVSPNTALFLISIAQLVVSLSFECHADTHMRPQSYSANMNENTKLSVQKF
ncbi:uncharacterized protein BO66DRAFT_3805 [Aspergillus aculeatinus CBS 121060]|uniref:Uncharacterized protein n=1 Tax=Aspergillus aculeatinus CBS 121060 TaxID=1448322 RepID=A0ACD1HP55_9EURO|nr:hypothetical protein BO66DRAFT_3805 [Aspergillus aculeatinus CBS 121060]RAH75242.1 hypothetical protein BO66DRAFT_3805 [Aspergillus aculeatinus CBS 121060]